MRAVRVEIELTMIIAAIHSGSCSYVTSLQSETTDRYSRISRQVDFDGVETFLLQRDVQRQIERAVYDVASVRRSVYDYEEVEL